MLSADNWHGNQSIDLVNSAIIFLSQITLLRLLTFLLGSLTVQTSHSLSVLDFFFSSGASICFTMAFPPFWNSDQVVVSVFIDFPLNSKRDALFHRVAYDYSSADWDGLRDHLRDVPYEDNFRFSASAHASEFWEWVQVGIGVCIPNPKYQVKPHSSPWFSATCAAVFVHRNHFFHLHRQNESPESKIKIRQASNRCRQASNRCKRVLEAAKLSYSNNTRVNHFLETRL